MSNDKKFESKDELEAWLKDRGVGKDDVGEAAEKLISKGFNKPSRILGITVEMLQRAEFGDPLALDLSNKLSNDQQQVSQSNHPVAVRSFVSWSHSSTHSTQQ